MPKRREKLLIDGKSAENIEICANHIECDVGKVRLYIGKNVIIAKGKTKLDPLGLGEVSWKAKYKPETPEYFEMEMSLSRVSLKGRFPSLIIWKKLIVHDGEVFIPVQGVEGSDARTLRKNGVELDSDGFLRAGQIKNAVKLINSGEIKVGAEARESLENLANFEKVISRAGAVLTDAVKLPASPAIADKLAKEDLRNRRLE